MSIYYHLVVDRLRYQLDRSTISAGADSWAVFVSEEIEVVQFLGLSSVFLRLHIRACARIQVHRRREFDSVAIREKFVYRCTDPLPLDVVQRNVECRGSLHPGVIGKTDLLK